METKVYDTSEKDLIAEAVRNGALIAIKTDTVYGLAASSADDALYKKLQEAKERPETKPFPLMVSSFEQIEAVADVTPRQRHLMHAFMPGAVTFIFKRKQGVFDFLGDQDTLGIRMADDAWVASMIEGVGAPIWLPSANRSGLPTATSSGMVLEQLSGRIEGVVAGEIKGGISSSVFDLTGPEIVCLREGKISLEMIKKEDVMERIMLASDQGGFAQKEALKEVFVELGYEVVDYGVPSEDSVDYPDVIYPAVKAVADGEFERGVILCGTGIGASIVANKVRGIRAALVTSTEVAQLTREHNNSNILAMAGRTTPLETNKEILRTWLGTAFSEDERHQRRIDKISDIEIKEGR